MYQPKIYVQVSIYVKALIGYKPKNISGDTRFWVSFSFTDLVPLNPSMIISEQSISC